MMSERERIRASIIILGDKYTRGNGEDIAKALGVSVSTIRRWRKNPELIPYGKMRLLCRLRDIPEDRCARLLKGRLV